METQTRPIGVWAEPIQRSRLPSPHAVVIIKKIDDTGKMGY
jgi:hypothetical protein